MSSSFASCCRLVGMTSLATLVLTAAPSDAQVLGRTSAVNPNSSPAGRTLTTGAQIIHNESVHTDAKGSLQLLFIDRTSMSIGPNADLVIDDYVFDTKSNTGSMTVSLGKGLMRFIGGQVTHSGETLIKTPAALFGIRGGTAQFSVGPKGTQAVFLGGNSPGAGLTVTPTGNCKQQGSCPA